jgi:alkylated DNA repair dioxygenase AlkB
LIKGFISEEQALTAYESLKENIPWQNELLTQSGEKVKIKRKMCYVYNKLVEYNYGNLILQGIPWRTQICPYTGNTIGPIISVYPRFLKFVVNDKLGYNFNSVLLNYYENGKDKINWHADKEPQLGENPVIVSLNLGATRNFHLLEKATGEREIIPLSNGDILIMKEGCQEHCLHAILPEKEVKEGRISLTFRKVVYE